MKKILIIVVVIGVIAGSCKKGFLSSLQNDPNSPTSSAATPQLVLPGCLTSLVNIVNSTSYQTEASWMGYWMYSPGYSFNSTVENYVMTSSSPQHWDDYYGVLANLNFIAGETTTPDLANYHDISTILEAVCYKNLADLYDKIPFTQALKGSGDFNPTYDDGSVVYDSLVARLDAAIADIQANLGNSAVARPASDDIAFGGDMTQWMLFANTVKLKLLVQQSAVSSKAATLSAEATKTASVGFLTQDALVNPGYTQSQPSPMWGAFGVSPSGALNGSYTFIVSNQTIIDFYTKTNDQRLAYFCGQNKVNPTMDSFWTPKLPVNPANYSGNYLGIQNSLPNGGSGIGPGIVQSPNQSAVLMLAAESYFVQAEATILGWLSGGLPAAQALYQKGIIASYEYLNVGGSTAAADTYAAAYIGQPNVGYVTFATDGSASNDSLMHTVITQKWAALNSISNVEAYNDWRRTYNPALNSGYPIVPVSKSTSNVNPHAPFRYFYPTEEATSNGASWQAAGGPSVDVFNNKIFWMP
ncbi:MAG TPA: SusD/RagB family nutrient-binding outer membrane lipoprotein [Puia sp.]|nr:SusD/RagB family nutrient-binding outer membrane lipoprotein [Puia sp.]